MVFKKGNIPWSKGKKFPYRKRQPCTEETKKKISETRKAQGNPWRYGIPLSEEHKRNIGLANKGRIRSEEENHKISLANTGKRFTEEHKKKIGAANKGKRRTEEHKQKYREARLKQVFPKGDTLIEKAIQKELTKRGIFFQKQISLIGKYQADILINNLVVECDGDYWHNYPDGLEKDRVRDKDLIEAGYQVLRFWGNEIKSDAQGCVDQVISVLSTSVKDHGAR